MDGGIHVQLAVDGVRTCPVSSVDESVAVRSVVTSRRLTADGSRVVGELTVPSGAPTDSLPTDDPVFADGDRATYRFSASGDGCPCGLVPDRGCPVRDLRADGGGLAVTFIAPDVETVRAVVPHVAGGRRGGSGIPTGVLRFPPA